MWEDKPYDFKSDVWSIGCIVYEMTALKLPFQAEDMNGLYQRVCKGQYPPIPSYYTEDLIQTIDSML